MKFLRLIIMEKGVTLGFELPENQVTSI